MSEWTREYTNDNQVAITLDSDLLINLTVYGPLNLYIPQAITSPTPDKERYERFFEVINFYGLTAMELKSLLDDFVSHASIHGIEDSHTIQMGLMNLALFYGKYHIEKMPEVDKVRMVKDYIQYLRINENRDKLRYKADYLIISRHDKEYVQRGSSAERIMNSQLPLFKNELYKVYELK